MSESVRTQVFVSYSHLDDRWRERIRKVLGPDIRNDRIEYWDDRSIQAGDDWYKSIGSAVERARVALLLVTPEFLASEFIQKEEIPRISQAAIGGGLAILWLPVSGTFTGPGRIPETSLLDRWQAICDPATPLADLDEAVQERVLLALCRRVGSLLRVRRFVSNLPFGSLGDLFKGRERALAEVSARLSRSAFSAIVQPEAISGLGGIGKTRLAIEYAWRHRDRYVATLFLTANEPEDLRANLAALSRPDILDLAEFALGNPGDQRDAVVRWLQENEGWLLILDNVDSPEGVDAAQRFAARLTGGHILITSRITQWGRGVDRFPLDVITLEDSVRLLLESTEGARAEGDPQREVQEAVALAERLGYLPLALTHAAAYIGYQQISIREYLGEMDRSLPRLLEYHDDTVIEYETEPQGGTIRKTIATTFFLSFDRLGATAKTILQASAFLAPEQIPRDLFKARPSELEALVELWCEESGETPASVPVRDALAELARYSLVSRDGSSFQVHRMEQEVLRARTPRERVASWIERLREAVAAYAPDESAESPNTWEIWVGLRPHATALVEAAERDPTIRPDLRLMSALAAFYFGRGEYSLSLAMEERALAQAERHHGPDSEEVADRLIPYGESLRVLARLKEAEQAFRRCLALREGKKGPDDLGVATALNYLALVLHHKESPEAEEHYRRAIAIYDAHGNAANRNDLSKTLNNLGVLLMKKEGCLDEAEAVLTRAVEVTADGGAALIRPQLAMICRLQLANIKITRQAYEEATRLFEAALERALAFPPGNPYRTAATDEFANFLSFRHELGRARRVYEEAGQPPAGVRGVPVSRRRLRIVEAAIDLPAMEGAEDSATDALVEEARFSEETKAYVPMRLVGVDVLDAKTLECTFRFDSGHEPESRDRTGHLLEWFATAVATPEHEQWAGPESSSDVLLTTRLGSELRRQAAHLRALLRRALAPATPAGAALRGAARVEVWVRLEGGLIYDGDIEAARARLEGKEPPEPAQQAEDRAYIVKAPLGIAWQCTTVGRTTSEERARLDDAFGQHAAPLVLSALAGAKLFAGLRQANDCMVLATWFKGRYRWNQDVAKYLETGDPYQWKMRLREEKGEGDEPEKGRGPPASKVAQELNQQAVDLRAANRAAEAEPLLREALALEERVYTPQFPKIPHRLNNLASVLLMQGKLAEGCSTLERAWSLNLGRRDVTSGRILFARILAALLLGEDASFFVGQLKNLLEGPKLYAPMNVVEVSDFRSFLDPLGDRLEDEARDLLGALADALNDSGTPALALDRHPLWRDSSAVPWSAPWPET